MIKVGDVYKIQLADQKWAYGQYAFRDKHGPILRIFNQISTTEIPVSSLDTSQLLFKPIIMGLAAAVRGGLFQKMGFLPVKAFQHPGFISTFYDEKTGKASIWFLWNGEKSIRIGQDLPAEYKEHEYLIVWNPYDVIERIETGYYPFPYQELINHNAFQPRSIAALPSAHKGQLAADIEYPQSTRLEPNDQSVIIHLDGVNLPKDVYKNHDLATLEEQIVAILDKYDLGHLDGHEFRDNEVIIIMYGPNAEKMFAMIETILRSYPLCQNATIEIHHNGQKTVKIGFL